MTSRLQQEIQQSRAFGSLREEAVLQLVRSAALIMHQWEQQMRPYGITPTQYNVLRILRGAGTVGLHRRQIACRLLTPVPDVSRLLDRMMQAGLLTRTRGTADKRTVHSKITEKGLCILKQLDGPASALPDAHLSELHEDEVRQLIRLLELTRPIQHKRSPDPEQSASQ